MTQSPQPHAARERLIAGAMSGTSGDGVDVAITRVRITEPRAEGLSAELVRHHHLPFDPAVRELLFKVRGSGTTSLSDLATLGRKISLSYARAVNESLAASHLSARDLDAVAAHGQTLYHAPPDTIQWFDPALVAAEVGCAVISDFRRADCAAGGQGAPLVPFADYVLFRHPTKARAVVNIGGIANVTCLFPGAGIDQVIAFDTGPGNCISDYLMRKHDPNGPGVDLNGSLALTGRISRPVWDSVMAHPFFLKLDSKSTDGPEMIRIFEAAVREHAPDLPLADQLATANMIAGIQISRALNLFGGQFIGELIISGGGIHNRSIMQALGQWRSGPYTAPEQFGRITAESKEALAFALLGAATLEGIASNIPRVTGARRPVLLGSITPRP